MVKYARMALKFGVIVPFGPKFSLEFEPFDRNIFGQPYYPGQLAITKLVNQPLTRRVYLIQLCQCRVLEETVGLGCLGLACLRHLLGGWVHKGRVIFSFYSSWLFTIRDQCKGPYFWCHKVCHKVFDTVKISTL